MAQRTEFAEMQPRISWHQSARQPMHGDEMGHTVHGVPARMYRSVTDQGAPDDEQRRNHTGHGYDAEVVSLTDQTGGSPMACWGFVAGTGPLGAVRAA